MKVLIDLTSLADNFSGIERYAACLSIEMVKDTSIDFVLLFKSEIHPLFSEIVKQQNVEYRVIPRCKKLFFNQIRLPNVIRKIKADYYLFLAFPVPVFLFKNNMISTIHDICCWDCPETMNGMSKWYFRISHRMALLKCYRIITISEFSKKRIVERLHYDENKIWLIYCGVDSKFLNYDGDKGKSAIVKAKYNLPDKYILSLSTIEPRKNLQLLVKAYSELRLEGKIDVPLVLAGRKGWKMEQLLSSINDSIKSSVLFTGFIDDEDLPYVYGNASLFVFPSMYEGFGIPPLEAMACGTQVLSSDSTSLPEVLGLNACYFESDTKNSLKDKIVECVNSCTFKIVQSITFYWSEQARALVGYILNDQNKSMTKGRVVC